MRESHAILIDLTLNLLFLNFLFAGCQIYDRTNDRRHRYWGHCGHPGHVYVHVLRVLCQESERGPKGQV